MASDEIVVQTTDIEVIRDALNSAYYKNVAEDHAEAYRKQTRITSENPDAFKSPLSNLLWDALVKAQAALQLAEGSGDDETPSEPEDDGGQA